LSRAPFAVCLAALLALIGAPGRADSPRTNGTTIPHVLRYSSAEEIATLNPDLSVQTVVFYLSQLTGAYFFRFDRENRLHPELATAVPTLQNGGISKDGLTIAFHLRKGVKWSDGEPFSADDPAFTIAAINNPANDVPSRDGFDQITKVEEPDKYTLVIHLKRPYGGIVETMFGSSAQFAVLPKHVLGSLPDMNNAPFNALPVGIGPFRYAAWNRGEAVELERNPYYWRGRPALAKFVYKIIPARNTVLVQMSTGELDMWYPFGGSFLAKVQAIPSVRVLRRPGYSINMMLFNMTDPVVGDRAVRLALRYGFDRRNLRDKIGHGVGLLQDVPWPQADPMTPKDIPFTAYDPKKAAALLDKAGWKVGSDGIRVKNGTRLTINVASSSGTPDADSALELIRATWKDIGVDMNIQRYQSSMLFAPYEQGGIVQTGKFGMVFLGRTYTLPMSPRNIFGCDAKPPGGQNSGKYCNPKVDALIDEFDHTYDEAKRTELFSKMTRIIEDDVPLIVTTGREDLFGFNRDLKNFAPNSVSPFDDFMRVDI
jgi:peptide/nickel transport system substrate-binding protein